MRSAGLDGVLQPGLRLADLLAALLQRLGRLTEPLLVLLPGGARHRADVPAALLYRRQQLVELVPGTLRGLELREVGARLRGRGGYALELPRDLRARLARQLLTALLEVGVDLVETLDRRVVALAEL